MSDLDDLSIGSPAKHLVLRQWPGAPTLVLLLITILSGVVVISLLVEMHKQLGTAPNTYLCDFISLNNALEEFKQAPAGTDDTENAGASDRDFSRDECRQFMRDRRMQQYLGGMLILQHIGYALFFAGRALSIRRYRSTRALWLCLVPGFSPGVVLGIPVAIWALVRLRKAPTVITSRSTSAGKWSAFAPIWTMPAPETDRQRALAGVSARRRPRAFVLACVVLMFACASARCDSESVAPGKSGLSVDAGHEHRDARRRPPCGYVDGVYSIASPPNAAGQIIVRVHRPPPGYADDESELIWRRKNRRDVVFQILAGLPPPCPLRIQRAEQGDDLFVFDYSSELLLVFNARSGHLHPAPIGPARNPVWLVQEPAPDGRVNIREVYPGEIDGVQRLSYSGDAGRVEWLWVDDRWTPTQESQAAARRIRGPYLLEIPAEFADRSRRK
ncbi:MAG: hypothetical protein NXI24_24680 [bacterium]|nr:hypothetical protein [bacterium]